MNLQIHSKCRRGVNGWQTDGSNFILSRRLSNGRYLVEISSAKFPEIISAGEAWCPSAGGYISDGRLEMKLSAYRPPALRGSADFAPGIDRGFAPRLVRANERDVPRLETIRSAM